MNYESFYGFEGEPFSDIPDPVLFYSGPEHTRALVKLLHVIKKGRALGVLTGGIGCGKTTIARRILDEMDRDEDFHSGLIVLTHPDFSPEWFLIKTGELLGLRFNSMNRTEMVIKITRCLSNRNKEGKHTVIIIDEANNFTNSEALEELRGLLNLELISERLVTFILSGMQEMLDNIRDNISLRQRISTIVNLPPLTLNSTREYIKYRVEQTGVSRELFNDEAYDLIYQLTDGVPRVINVMCDNALLEGALLKKKVIESSILKRVGEELLLKG